MVAVQVKAEGRGTPAAEREFWTLKAPSFNSAPCYSVAPARGFSGPCLPSPAKAPPSGPDWLHEIKHDGFRLMGRRNGRAALHPKRTRFRRSVSLIVAVVMALPARSCLIDG